MFFKKLLLFLFLSSYNLPCEGQTPRVMITRTAPRTMHGKNIVVERDTDLVMDCFVENLLSDMTVRWQREYTDPIDGIVKTGSILQDTALDDSIHYSIERPSLYTWSLWVRGVQLTDDGEYKCFVQLNQVSVASEIRNVYVIIKPYFEPQNLSPDVTVNEGEDMTLLCNATGYPQPSVQWQRLGGQVLSVGQEIYEGVKLPLKDIAASDRGTYICTAINKYGRATYHVDVRVKFHPIIFIASPVVYQAVGYRIELQCFVEANPYPKSEVSSWAKGTATPTDRYEEKWIEGAFNRMTYELIIKDVQEEDYDTFTCKVSNDDLTTGLASKTIRLGRTDVPQNSVKLGRPVRGDESASVSIHQSVTFTLLFSIAFTKVILEK